MKLLRILIALGLCTVAAHAQRAVYSTTSTYVMAPTAFSFLGLTNATAANWRDYLGAAAAADLTTVSNAVEVLETNTVLLTGAQTAAGIKTFSSQVVGASFTLGGYTNAGIFSPGGFAGVDVNANGTLVARFWTAFAAHYTRVDMNGSPIAFGPGAAQTYVYARSPGILIQEDGTTAQTNELYFTRTDASNYQRASLRGTASAIELAAETAGTGADNLDINLIPAGTGGVVINGGAGIKKLISNTATLDFDLSAVDVEDLTVAATGAALGDVVAIGVPHGSVTATAQFTGWVSAWDTVTIRCVVAPAAAENPASGTFRVTVIKH